MEGEYSYADLSENFSAQDGEETEGLDLEAFEYDPKDKEFLEELLAVAPEEEKQLLRRLSVVKNVEAEDTTTTAATTTDMGLSEKAQQFLPSADQYIREQAIWQSVRNRSNKPRFNKLVNAYAIEVGKLSQEDAAAIVRAVNQAWITSSKLVVKRTQKAKEKEDLKEEVASRKLEKAMARKEMLWESGRERREAKLLDRRSRPRRTKEDKEADDEAEREEAAAQLAVEEALKSLDEAKMRALRKRKRTPDVDEKTKDTPLASTTKSEMGIKPETSNQQQQQLEPIKLVGAQDWYGDEGEEKTEVSQPQRKRARKGAKKGPAVSTHFPAPSAKALFPKVAPSVLITTEDVVMEDVSEDTSEVAVEVKQSAVQGRDSSVIGNTADDEDRPITFSGGAGDMVERVLRTEETIKPISIRPSAKTHQIEESKVRVPTEAVDERPNKVIKQEKRIATGHKLKQQDIDEERAIKKMAGVARAAVQAAKRTVAETVKQNELNMPAVKKLEKEAKELEWKAKSIEDRNKSRMKRPRNNNKLKVQPPTLSKEKLKVNTPNAKKVKPVAVVDNKAKLDVLAAKERENNDPAIVAKRLAEGLSAKGKQPRKTRGGRDKGPKSTPAAAVLTSPIDALATKVDANSEKPNDGQKVKKSRRGGKNKAAKADAAEVSKDHHS